MSGTILVVGSTERTSSIVSLLKDANLDKCVEVNDGLAAFSKLLENDSINLVITEWNTHCHKTSLPKRMKRSDNVRIKKMPVICLASSKLANSLEVADTNGDILLFSPFSSAILKEKIETFLC